MTRHFSKMAIASLLTACTMLGTVPTQAAVNIPDSVPLDLAESNCIERSKIAGNKFTVRFEITDAHHQTNQLDPDSRIGRKISDAMEVWSNGITEVDISYDPNSRNIVHYMETDYPEESSTVTTAGYYTKKSEDDRFDIYINAAVFTTELLGSNLENFLTSTIVHEFGHALGIDDNILPEPEEKNLSIMNQNRDKAVVTTPQKDDFQAATVCLAYWQGKAS